MDNTQKLIKIFLRHNALLEGHFLLSSGRHSDKYLQGALILQYPKIAAKLAKQVVTKLPENIRQEVETVISPALGGVIWGQEVARILSCRSIFTEREQGVIMKLRRGFKIKNGEKFIVAEDVVTTGKSTNEVIDIVKQSGGKVLNVVSLVDRSGGDMKFEVPLTTLFSLTVENYLPEECPLCKQNIEIVKPGSRGTK